MLVMRRRDPGIKRPFRAPLVWLVGPGAIVGCLYLFASLEFATLWRFVAWNALGLAVYALYARPRSRHA